MSRRVIGQQQFTDGAIRPVYEDKRGQYVIENGERLDGVWIMPGGDEADLPLIVGRSKIVGDVREAP
jgi:hypothetical protein